MDLYVAESTGKGRGVFAARPFKERELIETCDAIIIPAKEVDLLKRTVLFNYLFSWADGSMAVALGNGSLYNHSSAPNAAYRKDYGKEKIHFIALEGIAAGEEIMTDYNSWHRGRELWFRQA